MFTSLRTRLALSSVGISLAVLLLLFAVSYASLGNFLEDSNVATTRHNLQIAMDLLDHEVAALKQLMSWLSVNGQVQDFVTSPREDEASERRKKLAAFEVVHNVLYGNTLYSTMNKFIVVDRHGRAIQTGNVSGHWSDGAVARRTAEEGAEILSDPYFYSNHSPVIALSRVVYEEYSGDETAWIQVTLGTDFLSKYLSSYSFEPDSRMFFVLGSSVLQLDPRGRFVPSPHRAFEFLKSVPGAGQARLNIDGIEQLFVTYQAKGTGWRLVQSVPRTQFDRQNSVFVVLFAFVVVAMGLLVALLLVLVDRTINKPVLGIQRRLAAIARGDFGHEPAIEFRNELGDIGRGINAMSQNIDDLITRRLEDERSQKNLEYKVLQSQINPHFLYNTLNSIKWMAEIQKSRGIGEMAGSLAVLLKHVAKGTDELIPLREELDLVREYCTIQDYRTGGLARLKVVLEDPALAACPVLKFTLQPLVENALQHGIEPTGRPGNIVIHVHRGDDDLQIDVTDDGAGIPREKLATVLCDAENHERSFNPIGLKNVDERIKLRFGSGFGLSVQSEPGIFTTVKVRIPWSGGAGV